MAEPISIDRIFRIPKSGKPKNEEPKNTTGDSGSEPANQLPLDHFLERVRKIPCRVCGKAAAECECPTEPATARKNGEALPGSEILAEHADAMFKDFSSDIAEAAIVLLDQPRLYRGLWIAGNPGTGKSRLAVAIYHEGRRRGLRHVGFFRAKRLFARLWAVYREGSTESEEVVLDRLGRLDLLVIDDLGHEGRPTDAVLGALHDILSERHGNYHPTVITTNLSLEEISKRYDESIASRIGSWASLVLRGEDRRSS